MINKQEAIDKIKNIGTLKINDTVLHQQIDMIVKNNVLDIISQIHEPQKVTVPKFVGEWIKSHKESFSDASAIDMYDNLTLDNRNGYYHEVWLWVIAHHHDFIKAWHDGYEIEKEKLYTVEIPNPNSAGGKTVLSKQQGTGRLILQMLNSDINKPKYLQLTESEIKQDFEWAWQFAEEVKE